jgi:hypothetical protein
MSFDAYARERCGISTSHDTSVIHHNKDELLWKPKLTKRYRNSKRRLSTPVETVTKEEPPETERRERSMSFTRTVQTSEIEAIVAPFPNTKGTITIKVLNGDQSLGPAVVLLSMEPGSEIARHLHERTIETSYVLDGEFINEGIAYPTGTEWNVKPMMAHGPHTTKTGCSVLLTFSYPSALDDFTLA